MTEQIEHLSQEIVSRFVDNELPPAEARALQEHATACHPCANRIVAALRLKAAVADAGANFAPSTEVLTRLRAGIAPINDEEAVARRTWFPTAAWSALAAALLLVIVFAGWQQVRRTNTLTAELLDQHLATLSSGALSEVISTDKHTVKPWFQGKLPFSFNLPDTLPPDTQLKGGDLTYVRGKPSALLLFTIHKHQVSVFVMAKDGAELPQQQAVRAGFSVREVTSPELRLIGVSDVNPAELDQLMTAITKAQ